jgi:23S rRNA (uracil1939-C5)-methyltransferase
VGDCYELRIDSLSVSGDGVGRLEDGRVVFVPRALPGDRVRVQLAATRKRVQYAELLEILEPSPDRVQHPCSRFACSGCPLGGLATKAQARAKHQQIVETLLRIGRIDVGGLLGPVVHEPVGWQTRHRVRLHTAFGEGGWKIGFHEQRSRNLVPLSSCALMWPELEEAMRELHTLLAGLADEARLLEVDLAYSRRDARAAAKLSGSGPILAYKRWFGDLKGAKLCGVIVETQEHLWRYGNVDLRYDHSRAGDFDLRFEPGVFTQANPSMNDNLVHAVVAAVRAASPRRLLELHSGIGNFSLPLGLAGVPLVASERQGRAVVLCRRNARSAQLDLEVWDKSDEEAVADLSSFDSVLLDPPRAGARAAVEAIAASPGISHVVYVSCDVATLARDAAVLVRAGFAPVAAQAFDLFPQTPHAETMLVLARP